MWTWRLVPASGFCFLIAVLPSAAHWTGPVPAGAPDKAWWDGLASAKGLCCSFADGQRVENVDWDNGGPHNGYRVRLAGQWIDVPPGAVVAAPNKFGAAVVWPYQDVNGNTQIRCFIPGAQT